MPQIEVTFDIDANGLVAVSAKDRGTGKEQKITVQASTRLTDDEIKKMVKDAELHAEEDKKKRETIEARNGLDSMCFQAEKMLRENGDKVPADLKASIETAVTQAKSKLTSEDTSELKAAREALEAEVHKIAEAIYKEAGAKAAGGADGAGQDQSSKKADDVVDAEYEDGSKK
jgi:molecular chaperone DnaK